MNKQLLIALSVASLLSVAYGCTNLLVSPGAAKAGNSMIYYSADSTALFGKIDSLPAADYPEGTMMQVYDWDSGVHTGEIPQASHTYNVIANINEHGLTIGETTFGGLEILCTDNGIIDYGTLIWTTLQRAKTAREAIHLMDKLTQEYGYYSAGESFSIADKDEVWVLEMIGKGDFEKGTVWVALRVPDGHITGHSNQARIPQFPRNDSDNCLYSPDVVDFAVKHGLYNGTNSEMSFSDVYCPLSFSGARLGNARTWSNFNFFKDMAPWLDYAQGKNLTNVMPWSIPISEEQKLTLNDTFWVTRNHFQDTWFQNTQDVGAGPFNSPYRWRPLEWKYDGKEYINERTVAIQQSGWNFASEIRKDVPAAISGVTWFAMDDSCCGVKVPIYGSNNAAPVSWALPKGDKTRSGDVLNFNFNHAFWTYNMVANYAYQRWSEVYPEVSEVLIEQEQKGFDLVAKLDSEAADLIKKNETEKALEYIQKYTTEHANNMTIVYQELYGKLFAKYRDGGVITAKSVEESPACGCETNSEGYTADGDRWYGRIVNETGSKYEVISQTEEQDPKKKRIYGFKN